MAVVVAFALGLGAGMLVGGNAPCGEARQDYRTLVDRAVASSVDEGRILVAEARAIASDRSDCFTPEELRSLPRPPP